MQTIMPTLLQSSILLRRVPALLVFALLLVAGCDSDGGGGNESPTANFSSSTDGLTVSFSSQSSDADGSIASYAWSFGDGGTSTDEDPTYTYGAAGDYDVELTVTDDEGASASVTKSISVSENMETISDDITENTTWSAGTTYMLDGLIFVNEGATLTIEAGTVIKGLEQNNITTGDGASALIVRRGAQIDADGSADAPIIFTSELDDLSDPADMIDGSGNVRRGLWGGVIILGAAPTNQPETDTDGDGVPDNQIEGIPVAEEALYGGNDAEDDSGTFRYVSIRHGGFSISGVAGDEINGLTLGGVGRGTTIEYVEVFANDDDGIEWFGGTVETKYLAMAFMGDDGFDYDQGFTGKGQYWFALHGPDQAGRGGEHDGGDAAGDGATPFAIPVIANVTYIGSGVDATPGGGDDGDRTFAIRDNAGGMYYNSIFTEYPETGVNIEDLEDSDVDSRTRLEEGDLMFVNTLWYGYGAGNTLEDIVQQQFVRESDNFGGQVVDPELAGVNRANGAGGLDPRPGADAATSGADDLEDDFFDDVDFLGAFDPGEPLWIEGWTALSSNGYTDN